MLGLILFIKKTPMMIVTVNFVALQKIIIKYCMILLLWLQ